MPQRGGLCFGASAYGNPPLPPPLAHLCIYRNSQPTRLHPPSFPWETPRNYVSGARERLFTTSEPRVKAIPPSAVDDATAVGADAGSRISFPLASDLRGLLSHRQAKDVAHFLSTSDLFSLSPPAVQQVAADHDPGPALPGLAVHHSHVLGVPPQPAGDVVAKGLEKRRTI